MNLLIAVFGGAVIGLAARTFNAPTFVSTALGACVLALSLVAIYLRGYIVPGTPTLTKRYFPDHVLRWFDKEAATSMATNTISITPEQVLIDAGAVKACRENTDLCLTSDFQTAWKNHVQTIRGHEVDETDLERILEIPANDDQITFDRQGDAIVAHTDTDIISQWPSQAATIADVATSAILRQRSSEWSKLTSDEIARVLMSFRIFVEHCPACDGKVQVEEEAVKSCCRSYDVVASTCKNCNARLFEVEWNGSIAGAEMQTD